MSRPTAAPITPTTARRSRSRGRSPTSRPSRSAPTTPPTISTTRKTTSSGSTSATPTRSKPARESLKNKVRPGFPGRTFCFSWKRSGVGGGAERGQHALDLVTGQGELLLIGREAGAHMALAGIAEGGAGDDGHLLFREQAAGESTLVEPGRGHGRKGIERPARRVTLEAGGVDAADEQIPALAIAVAHELGRIVTQAQGGERAFLADARRAQHRVLVHLHHGLDQGRRSAGIAETETRHGKGLGEAVEQQRALAHAGQAGDAGVCALEDQLRVDLVADDDEVLLDGELRDALELFARADAARRIARQVQEQEFAPGLPRGLQG